jgi:hypothetical protein
MLSYSWKSFRAEESSTWKVKPEAWLQSMPTSLTISAIQDQAYVCHPGNQAGVACAFSFASPPRTKIIPYSYLLSIDTLGDRLITLHYSFANVEISLGKDFPGKNQLIEDLANFRVSALHESYCLKLRILMEPDSEKTALF